MTQITSAPAKRRREGQSGHLPPQDLDCHLVAGDFAYFLKICVYGIEDFNRFHGELLTALPGVRQTCTFFVMKKVVDDAPLEF